jgi:hypothetical protein
MQHMMRVQVVDILERHDINLLVPIAVQLVEFFETLLLQLIQMRKIFIENVLLFNSDYLARLDKALEKSVQFLMISLLSAAF